MGRLDRLPSRTMRDGLVVHEATTLRARLLGLALLRNPPPPGHALLIPDCRSVHTFGMRFPIDVAFLDERGQTLRIERDVPPWRVLICRGAFAVLETPSLSPPRPPAARGAASKR
jgi:uncharacterized membrane protein (UPF0127 family)